MADKEKIYKIIYEFVRALKNKEEVVLINEFNLSKNVMEEIFEVLGEYFPDGYENISIAPEDLAFTKNGRRMNIDIFQMIDPERLGGECVLWNNERPDEPILHFELKRNVDGFIFEYKYIGS
ncbi:hypothetical protein [Comamonas composti]|uniref:hypothetical protein n=1 Tax=Comamonas composti TaxID=408558 RepID=UPI0012EB8309|nr:hypothetical protein [Comamonas composti]